VQQFWKTLTGITIVAGFSVVTLLGFAQEAKAQAAAPAAQAQPAKKVKDQGEFDLFDGATKATDPNKKLALLLQWKEKYPETDFKTERLQLLMQTYAQLGKLPEAINAAKEWLGIDPKSMMAMATIANLTPLAWPQNAPPDALDTADKAANSLLTAEMPANSKPEDKKKVEAFAHKTLGWTAWQRKNYDPAEQEFSKSLELDPNQPEVSYWLGTVMLAERKPDKQAPALYEFARAVSLDLPQAQGGLPAEMRQKLDAYLTKQYSTFHGSSEGLPELKAQAKSQALPPAGFAIKTKAELDVAKEEEFKKSKPALALWMSLKQALQAPDGSQFFDSHMKGAAVPGGAEGVQKFKGTLVSAKPAVSPKELVVAIADANTPEVTLKLETALRGKPVVGSELEFEGVPEAFTKEPFMVTFNEAKVTGLKTEAAPAPVRRPAGKKAAKKG
jgi:tetratricopeptide (TPR) repeat protein